MSKKSLFYVAGGALLILNVLAGWIFPYLYIGAAGEVVKVKSTLLISFLPLATGLALIAKAFLSDRIPNIVLVALFGLLALSCVTSFIENFIDMIRYDLFNHFISYVNLLSYGLMVVVYGGMAAIILLKDSLGGFFFAPAAVLVAKAFMWFLIRVIGMFGMVRVAFGFSLILLLIDCVLAAALFAVGMANNEE